MLRNPQATAVVVSPNRRPLTVEIPPGLDATTAAAAAAAYNEDAAVATATSSGASAAATEADIKLGERTAFIPMTCQERQVLDRLEAGLQSAAGLWRDSPQQQEHDQLLSSALHHWHSGGGPGANGVSTSWVWEVGRWSTQFSLPLALELRRLDPAAMADADQLLALSTCLRNRQIELAKRLAAAAASDHDGADNTSTSSSAGGKKKSPPQTKQQRHLNGLDEHQLDDEPCLCQIRWGLAPDTEAAKRRQLEKLAQFGDDDQQHHQNPQHHRRGLAAVRKQQQQQPSPPHHQYRQQKQHHQHLRPIVKTSHLRHDPPLQQQMSPEAPAFVPVDAGYASQNCSPSSPARGNLAAAAGAGGGGFINNLLASSGYGGRSWAD